MCCIWCHFLPLSLPFSCILFFPLLKIFAMAPPIYSFCLQLHCFLQSLSNKNSFCWAHCSLLATSLITVSDSIICLSSIYSETPLRKISNTCWRKVGNHRKDEGTHIVEFKRRRKTSQMPSENVLQMLRLQNKNPRNKMGTYFFPFANWRDCNLSLLLHSYPEATCPDMTTGTQEWCVRMLKQIPLVLWFGSQCSQHNRRKSI